MAEKPFELDIYFCGEPLKFGGETRCIQETITNMKKIDSILKGKVDTRLIETKKAKIEASLKVASLNATDELLSKELEYEHLVSQLATTASYEPVLYEMIACKQEMEEIGSFIQTLNDIYEDLYEDVEAKSE